MNTKKESDPREKEEMSVLTIMKYSRKTFLSLQRASSRRENRRNEGRVNTKSNKQGVIMVWRGTDIQFSEVIVVTTTIPPGYRLRHPFLTRFAKLNFAPCAENRITKSGKSLLESEKKLYRV